MSLGIKERERAHLIWEEDITFASDNTAQQGTEINGIKPDRSLTIFVNPDETALASTIDVEVQVAYESGGTYATLNTVVSGGGDGTLEVAAHDPDADGKAPYYRVQLSPTGSMSTETITYAVVQNDGAL